MKIITIDDLKIYVPIEVYNVVIGMLEIKEMMNWVLFNENGFSLKTTVPSKKKVILICELMIIINNIVTNEIIEIGDELIRREWLTTTKDYIEEKSNQARLAYIDGDYQMSLEYFSEIIIQMLDFKNKIKEGKNI